MKEHGDAGTSHFFVHEGSQDCSLVTHFFYRHVTYFNTLFDSNSIVSNIFTVCSSDILVVNQQYNRSKLRLDSKHKQLLCVCECVCVCVCVLP